MKRFHSVDHSNDKFWAETWVVPIFKRMKHISETYEKLLILSFDLCPIVANVL